MSDEPHFDKAVKAEHPFDKETLALMDKRPGKTEPGALPVETTIVSVAMFHWQELERDAVAVCGASLGLCGSTLFRSKLMFPDRLCPECLKQYRLKFPPPGPWETKCTCGHRISAHVSGRVETMTGWHCDKCSCNRFQLPKP